MDILAARKKAAERSKKKEAQPEPAAPAPAVAAEEPASAPTPETAEALQTPAPAAPPAQPVSEAPASFDSAGEPAPQEEIAEPEVKELETLSFRLGNEDYLVAVEQVKEVLRVRDATPVPHAQDYVTGVISLRGTILPVIDLAKRLGLPAGERNEKSRIIVVGLDDEDAGLIVDRVMGVVRFLPDAIQPVPDTLEQGAGAEYLKGIVRKDGRLYILLDLEKAAGK